MSTGDLQDLLFGREVGDVSLELFQEPFLATADGACPNQEISRLGVDVLSSVQRAAVPNDSAPAQGRLTLR